MTEYRESTVESAKREHRARYWLASFEAIVGSIKNQSTYESLSTLREFVYLDTTIGSPLGSIDGKDYGVNAPRLEDGSSARACFVPLFESDRSLAIYFKKLDMPTYNEPTRSVIMPPCKLGNEWRGILFFHEFQHAYHHANNHFRDTTEPHWIEEVRVFEEEHAVMKEVFPDFHTVISKGLCMLEGAKDNISLSRILKEVDWKNAFPRPQSKKELGLAQAASILALAYEDINRITHDKDKQLQRKVDFTKRFYAGNK